VTGLRPFWKPLQRLNFPGRIGAPASSSWLGKLCSILVAEIIAARASERGATLSTLPTRYAVFFEELKRRAKHAPGISALAAAAVIGLSAATLAQNAGCFDRC